MNHFFAGLSAITLVSADTRLLAIASSEGLATVEPVTRA